MKIAGKPFLTCSTHLRFFLHGRKDGPRHGYLQTRCRSRCGSSSHQHGPPAKKISKICKLHLYQSEYSRTVAHFNRHLRRLTEFSQNWGINEGSFEFWAWAARQYRLFAELLDYATRAGAQLPDAPVFSTSVPPSLPAHAPSNSVAPIQEHLSQPFGANPVNFIQHAGYYYFAAASCTQRRHRRYIIAASQEVCNKLVPCALAPSYKLLMQDPSSTSSPALANERKIDHQFMTLEVCFKYAEFKLELS